MFYDHFSARSLLAKLGRIQLVESALQGLDIMNNETETKAMTGALKYVHPIVDEEEENFPDNYATAIDEIIKYWKTIQICER